MGLAGYNNGAGVPTGHPLPRSGQWRGMLPSRPPNHIPPTREVCHEEVPVVVPRCRLPAGRIVHRAQAQADVKLPKVIGSHMVLQRDRPLPIWGWADPGEEVTVKLDEATATAKADAQGNWKVVLPAVKADGKAHSMTVSGKNKIELDDILIGEVWIGSGQSNMELGLAGSTGGKEAVAGGQLTRRYACCTSRRCRRRNRPRTSWWLAVPRERTGSRPRPARPGRSARPQTVPGFSAVLYYFGQRLHKDLDVPVGLINEFLGRLGHRALDGRGQEGWRNVQRHDRPREAAWRSAARSGIRAKPMSSRGTA